MGELYHAAVNYLETRREYKPRLVLSFSYTANAIAELVIEQLSEYAVITLREECKHDPSTKRTTETLKRGDYFLGIWKPELLGGVHQLASHQPCDYSIASALDLERLVYTSEDVDEAHRRLVDRSQLESYRSDDKPEIVARKIANSVNLRFPIAVR
jgi:hypothetical protein